MGEDPHRVAGIPGPPPSRSSRRRGRSAAGSPRDPPPSADVPQPPPYRGPERSAAGHDPPPVRGSPPWDGVPMRATCARRSPGTTVPPGPGPRPPPRPRRPPHPGPVPPERPAARWRRHRIDRRAGDERLLTRQEGLIEQTKTAFGPVAPVDGPDLVHAAAPSHDTGKQRRALEGLCPRAGAP